MDKLIATMATYNRESVTEAALSIANQVDELRIFHNSDDDKYRPVEHPNVVNIKLKENIGDRAKFLGWENKGYCFACDDDLVYPSNYVKEMMNYLDSYDLQVVSMHGVRFAKPCDQNNTYFNSKYKNKYHCLDGSRKFIVRYAHVIGTGVLAGKDLTLSISHDIFKNGYMADLWLSLELAKQKIERVIVPSIKIQLRYIKQAKGATLYEQHKDDCSEQSRVVNEIIELDE